MTVIQQRPVSLNQGSGYFYCFSENKKWIDLLRRHEIAMIEPVLPLVELLLPATLLATGLFFFHRSKTRAFIFSYSMERALLSCLAALLLLLPFYWWVTGSLFFLVYADIAGKYGHQALGSSWDIRLSYSLFFSLFINYLVLIGYIFYATWWTSYREDKQKRMQ